MKNKLLLLLGLCMCLPSFAQVYHPIPLDSAYWIEQYISPYQGGDCIEYTYKHIYPTGNTPTLDSNVYHEFRYNSYTHYQSFGWPIPCPGSFSQSNIFYALIRNDSANKKVYVYDMDSLKEFLAYDFDIQLGDTITHYGYMYFGFNCSEALIADSIDSIDIGGEFRTRYLINHFNNSTPQSEIIEGIGNDRGFMNGIFCPFELNTSLVCFHYKDLYYGDITSQYCTNTLSMEESQPDLHDFIVPVSPNLYQVKNEDGSFIEISCTDLSGKSIFHSRYNQSGYLDLSSYANGLYIVTALYNGKVIKPYKLVVQH